MKLSVFAALMCVAILCGCGHSANPRRESAPPGVGPQSQTCTTGAMGCSLRSSLPKALPPTTGRAGSLPDVSEFQGCHHWTASVPGVIFRLYEAGTNREDADAACNAHQLQRLGKWDAGYSFLRPGSCTFEADRTAAIIHAIGGIVGPVVADAEVPLPRGFVAWFDRRVASDTGNGAQVDYSSPGTHPVGNPPIRPVWVADYGVSHPGCVAGVCSHVAWQYTDNGCAYGLCGDLSENNGITAIRQTSPDGLRARQRTLVRVLAADGCTREG